MATIDEVVASLDNDNARHIVSLSGGKDSTALALYMRERYPEIPAEYVSATPELNSPKPMPTWTG